MSVHSVRELAKRVGLSHTTVSDALRNHPRVRRETRERVQREAEALGYRYNPLAGAVMSEIRRGGVETFRGTVAVVDVESQAEREEGARNYHRAVYGGAKAAAETMGFRTEPFVLGKRMSIARLGQVLETRGIRGVLVLPVEVEPDLTGLPWDRLTGIYTDYIIERPGLDCVCSDHFRSMVILLQKVAELGYRRPGFAISLAQDERLLHRWEAAFRTHLLYDPRFQAVPPLLVPEVRRQAFLPWFRKQKPDIVLCHRAEVLDWMKEAGAEVPRTHGFGCLNVMMSPVSVAGMDLQPHLIGQRAVQILASQIHHNAYGLPGTASTMTIPARWVDGPTARTMTRS